MAAPGAFADGAWHHVLVVFARSSNATTYFDGAVVDVQPLAGSTNDISTPAGLNLNVGQDGTGGFIRAVEPRALMPSWMTWASGSALFRPMMPR